MSHRWLAITAFALGCAPPAQPIKPSMDPASLTPSIQMQFARSAAAWNRGDLEAFISDYAPDSTTTFVAQGHVHHGFQYIRQRYAPQFAPGVPRDSLRFEEFETRSAGTDYALVTARYILYRNGITTASGPFTLLMQRRPEGWKIIHDHTSRD
jgi:uncharacterized protein (TIGR02246 family)